MGAKFYFFTHPASLVPQQTAQAFGVVAPSGGKDRFRQTDMHAAASGLTDPVPAFAICDAIVCAQTDDAGTLSLILKPIQQPPFDFPFIGYVIYKGIDPASLLVNGVATAGGTLDVSKAPANQLVDTVQKAWAANLNSGAPTRECLGLNLAPAGYPDGDALDRLFYQGDPDFQLPLVRGGWRIGDFSAAAFGLEVIVERIFYRPKIGLARKRENVIAVDSLDPNTVYAPNDAVYFQHWHDKEECLNFVDPSALWGSFFASKLRVWNGSGFDRLAGNAIYETVLRGTAAGAANFANRNRAYLDIRNEHGNSIDYYKADGPKIQLTLDADADIDTCEVDYYAGGWPSFAIDNTNLPAAATGDRIDARFALPRTAGTRPLIYVSAGYGPALRRLKDAERFFDRPRRADVPYLEEAAVTLPLIDDAGVKVFAGYTRLFSFKRPLIVNGSPPVPDPASLAPAYAGPLDHLFGVSSDVGFPMSGAPTILKTAGDELYVTDPTADYGGFAAKLTYVEDALNRYWLITPCAYYRWPDANGVFDGASHKPSLAFSSAPSFLADYVSPSLPRAIRQAMITPPPDAAAQSPVAIGVDGPFRSPPPGLVARVFQRTIVLCLPKADVAQFVAGLAADNPLPDSIFFVAGTTEEFLSGVDRYARTPLSASYIRSAAPFARKIVATSLEVYRDANP